MTSAFGSFVLQVEVISCFFGGLEARYEGEELTSSLLPELRQGSIVASVAIHEAPLPKGDDCEVKGQELIQTITAQSLQVGFVFCEPNNLLIKINGKDKCRIMYVQNYLSNVPNSVTKKKQWRVARAFRTWQYKNVAESVNENV